MDDLDIVAATEEAIRAADWLTPADHGAVEALRALARKIQAWDVIVEFALEDSALSGAVRPAVPANDNVSIPSYAKLCEQLGLTPSGRKNIGLVRGGESDKSAKLKALRGGRAAG